MVKYCKQNLKRRIIKRRKSLLRKLKDLGISQQLSLKNNIENKLKKQSKYSSIKKKEIKVIEYLSFASN